MVLKSGIRWILMVLGTIGLLFSTTAFWMTDSVYNQEAFTNTVVQVLSTEEVGQAVARKVVSEALVDRPVVDWLIGDYLNALAFGVLQTEAMQSLLEAGIGFFHSQVIGGEAYDVVINIAPLKNILSIANNLFDIEGIEQIDQELNLQQLPDSIVLIDASTVPNIYPTIRFMVWAGPVAGLVGLIMLVTGWITSPDRVKELLRAGGVITAISGLYYLMVPYLLNALSVEITDNFTRLLAGKILEAFAVSLQDSILTWILIGVAIMTISGVWTFLSHETERVSQKKKDSQPKLL